MSGGISGCHNWEWGVTGPCKVRAGMHSRVPCILLPQKISTKGVSHPHAEKQGLLSPVLVTVLSLAPGTGLDPQELLCGQRETGTYSYLIDNSFDYYHFLWVCSFCASGFQKSSALLLGSVTEGQRALDSESKSPV